MNAVDHSPPAGPVARVLAINGLGLYVMLMYGVTYYAIATAAPRMATDLGMPTSAVFAIITGGLLLTAAVATKLGEWTDTFGAASILVAGAVLRAILLAAMALAPDPVLFAVALLLVQVLGQTTEYDATFAASVALDVEKARSGMSQITLWGGFASTAFWPATAFLLEHMSWRAMFLFYAAIILFVCTPIALAIHRLPRMGLERTWRPVSGAGSGGMATGSKPQSVVPFWLVAAAFAFGGVAYNLPVLMLPVLEGLGLGASAVMIGMLFGPSQTAGRFVDMVLGPRVRAVTVAVLAAGLVAASFPVLLMGSLSAGLLFAVMFGAGAGVAFVVRGSVMLALYGSAGYAASLGRLGRVRLVVTALSPFMLASTLETFGAHAVVGLCAVAALLSLACFMGLALQFRGQRPQG